MSPLPKNYIAESEVIPYKGVSPNETSATDTLSEPSSSQEEADAEETKQDKGELQEEAAEEEAAEEEAAGDEPRVHTPAKRSKRGRGAEVGSRIPGAKVAKMPPSHSRPGLNLAAGES